MPALWLHADHGSISIFLFGGALAIADLRAFADLPKLWARLTRLTMRIAAMQMKARAGVVLANLARIEGLAGRHAAGRGYLVAGL